MSDLISRQAAIDALTNYGAKVIVCSRESLEDVQNALETVINAQEKAIKNLPAAQPELIVQGAYARGFEQGRTQGMIDAQGEKEDGNT